MKKILIALFMLCLITGQAAAQEPATRTNLLLNLGFGKAQTRPWGMPGAGIGISHERGHHYFSIKGYAESEVTLFGGGNDWVFATGSALYGYVRRTNRWVSVAAVGIGVIKSRTYSNHIFVSPGTFKEFNRTTINFPLHLEQTYQPGVFGIGLYADINPNPVNTIWNGGLSMRVNLGR